ncbi:iron complex transport system substrate-binding protein [Meinhardsimonia xiamenensis]|jgi:iron complex transport system substrate-binding protein|uniref:Iron complex transport system substrate-binding protein n=1 Tax=Meinhardsimonia xiamenensis TaxID=990712 RepID=A0A1G9FPW0_9RHOB|nr:siderophore ABC transporter substrate-binding protein [Meinhardsimonia xiamenensis]PRX37739.1 iron complex transport system substrate-binding protein [Meinhardsimonia xiamenensis]SDK90458.1 iron complex transport system substrate-binding protein [Meinhardsimonia xiamenensis]
MKHALAALLLCLPPLAADARTVTIETAAGLAEVPYAPDVVVALDLAAIDTLDALGVDLAGVPAITPPAYLAPAFEGTPTVGTLFEPDLEALAVMAPDLIVAGGRSQARVAALREIAPTIDMTIWGDDIVGQARARLTAYATIFGKQERAGQLLASLDEALAETRAAVEGKGNALIILTNGGKISAYGDDSRFGWLHTALGLPEAHPEIAAETHGESVSFEFIAEVNPDWLIVIDRAAAIGQEGEAAAATLDNPLVAGTTAGRNGQIVHLDSAAIYLAGGGIQSMMILLEQIRSAFAGHAAD